jgi:hypothetical protein
MRRRTMAAAARPTVRVQVTHGIELENLTQLIGKLVGPTGCRTCGLGGFDLAFVVDPDPTVVATKELAGIKGFEGATVSIG